MSTFALGFAVGCPAGQSVRGHASKQMIAEDVDHHFAIEPFISQKIARVKLENSKYRYTVLFEQDKPGAKNGHTGSARAVRVHGGYHFAPGRRRK